MSGVTCGAYHGFCRLRPICQKITQKFDGFLLRPGALRFFRLAKNISRAAFYEFAEDDDGRFDGPAIPYGEINYFQLVRPAARVGADIILCPCEYAQPRAPGLLMRGGPDNAWHGAKRLKRRLLNFVLSNCTWEDGEVVATFRQPFDLLAETTAIAARHGAGNAAKRAKSEIWLKDLDSNQD